jgi:predicted acylesterase/phospholipase RssA
MVIKHIVVSACVVNGIDLLGSLFEAENKELINVDNIKTVTGCSGGALILLVWLLRFDKATVCNFIINKSWNKTFKNKKYIMDIIQKKGVLDKSYILDIFTTFFKSESLDVNMTMLDLYTKTNITFNICATKLNDLKPVSISYKTYPDLPVLDAIYMSCSLPLLMVPLYYEDSYIIDGAFTDGYPIKTCLDNDETIDKNEILGLRVIRNPILQTEQGCNTLDYISCIMKNIINKFNNINLIDVDNEIKVVVENVSYSMSSVLNDPDVRKGMLENGKKHTIEFLNNRVKKVV